MKPENNLKANHPLRVGLVGMGFIGKIHSHAYQAIPYCFGNATPQANLCAILRTHTGSDKELLRSLGNPLETTQSEEFFNQNPDIVDICSPNEYHFKHVMLALEKGVHVYCEKPLAANLNQARQMAAKADQRNAFTHTAFNMRYYPAAQQAKSILASGALGEIYSFRAYFYHNSYMDPQRPTSWRLQKDISGGGALMDLGIHTIDLARFLLGDVHWVQCHTRTFISSRPKSAGSSEMVLVDVDDWALCVLGLENGAQGSIEVTRMSGGITDTSRVQIFGSLGSLEIDFNHPAHALYYDKNRNQTIYGAQEFSLSTGQRPLKDIYPPAKLSMGSFIDTHFACIMDFLLSIQEKHQSPLNFAAALKAQEILEAAYLSADRNGETIKLPIE